MVIDVDDRFGVAIRMVNQLAPYPLAIEVMETLKKKKNNLKL